MFEKFHAVLALLLSDGAVPSDCRALKLDPEELFENLKTAEGREVLAKLLGKEIGPVDWARFDGQIEAVGRAGARVVCLWDETYPPWMSVVSQPPPLLFYKGRYEHVLAGGVAVVGTRKPSPPGVAMARRLGRALSSMGVVVTSGLARGIDSAAHEGALSGGGNTVAVIGTGVDVPYPPENAELMFDVARDGCVVTEQLMGTSPRGFVFPLRNRLIAAMSHAVVVVQGSARSGALITARWALEQGREVGTVPGFPGDFRSDGVNLLLKQGAFLVENEIDIIHAVPRLSLSVAGADTGENPGRSRRDRSSESEKVLAILGPTPTSPDELAGQLDMEVPALQRSLLWLEMAGLAERDALGRYTKTR